MMDPNKNRDCKLQASSLHKLNRKLQRYVRERRLTLGRNSLFFLSRTHQSHSLFLFTLSPPSILKGQSFGASFPADV